MNVTVFPLLLFLTAAFASIASGQESSTNANTFLVDFTPDDVLALITCVGESGDVGLCGEYVQCLALMPAVVQSVYRECTQQLFPGGSAITCIPEGAILAPSATRTQVLNCMLENIREETPEEMEANVRTETCMRGIIERRCQRN